MSWDCKVRRNARYLIEMGVVRSCRECKEFVRSKDVRRYIRLS